MATIALGHLGREYNVSEGLSLYRLAWMNAAADLRATEIIHALNTRLGSYIEKDGVIESPHPFDYRLKPVERQLDKPNLPANLRTLFLFAAGTHYELAERPYVYGHGHPHHFNFERGENGHWTALNVDGLHAPAAYQLTTVCINPSCPAKFPHAPEITLDRTRFMRQVNKIAQLTGEPYTVVAQAALLNILHTAARRVDGTPEGQAPLNHFLALGKIASDVAATGLDPDLFTPTQP